MKHTKSLLTLLLFLLFSTTLFGASNVAPQGIATQVSDFRPVTLSSLANDNNINVAYPNLAVTQGGTAYDWWYLDLGDQYAIDSIKIFARNDNCGQECMQRLQNVRVMVSETPFVVGTTPTSHANAQTKADWIGQFPSNFSSPTLNFPSVNTTGRYVLIQKSGTNFHNILTLAAVQVFGTRFDPSAAVYSCPGQIVQNIDGATANATQSYTEHKNGQKKISRYFKFQTAVNGNITIHQKNNKPKKGYWSHQLKIGTSCNGKDIYKGPASANDSYTFAVTAGTTYYIRVREKNTKNALNFDIDFDFTADIAVNNPPTATSQSVTTPMDTAVNITLSGSDPDGDPIYYAIVNGGPSHGTLSGSEPTLTYTPDNGYVGNDSFDYQVCDIGGLCTTATVSISVTDTSLVATDNTYTTIPGAAITGNFISDDTGKGIDTGSNIVALTSTTNGPSKGTVTIAANGTFTYTPDNNVTGEDSFVYTITDSNGDTATATVTILVNTNFTNGNLLPFTIINPANVRNVIGNYKIAGNTVLCLVDKEDGYGDEHDSCINGSLLTSNQRVAKYLDIDGDIGTNGGTWNSTSSYMEFDAPYDPKRGVLWAGLFWGGRINPSPWHELRYAVEGSSNNFSTIEIGKDATVTSVNLKTSGAPNIKLGIDGGSYDDIVASTFHTAGQTYAAFADVTSTLQSASLGLGKHTFTVANLSAMEGREESPGTFGGWSLVVIYAENYTNGKPRNISIYNGFTKLSGNNKLVDIEIAGFKLPSAGTIDAKLSVFSGEGEYLFGRNPKDSGSKDWMKISDKKDSGFKYMPGKPDNNHLGNRDNMFDAQLDGILRDNKPSYNKLSNNVGVDVDNYDVSALMTDYRDDDENISSIYIKMYTNNDYITPSMMAFSAELFVPNLCYDYTLDIDGHVLTSSNNKIKTPFGNFGQDLTTAIYLKSEEGDIPLNNMRANYRIVNPSQLHYKDCSTEISETGLYDYSIACPYTYNATNSGFSMYIGTGKTTSSGGVINALENRYIKFDSEFQRAKIDTSFEFSVDYEVDYGSGPVPLRKIFTNADLCPPINTGFFPELGYFNVTDVANSFDKWNLYTQTSRRAFNLNIYAYDASNPTTLIDRDLNLTVGIEMIRADNFYRDAVTACNDAHSKMDDVPTKFVHFDESKGATFGYTNSEVNLAYRSAAMRVWYLTDISGNGFLVNNHNCTSLNQDECIDLYERDYNSSTLCSSECASSAKDGCYGCLRTTYGRKVCSRDNFAIRPEAFVLEVRDSDQDPDTTALNNIIANSTATSLPFSLIAGYDYRFDINATNHVNNNATPRYRQHFSPSGATHYVHMEQNFKAAATDCNDIEDKDISINVFNGSSVNRYAKMAYVDKVDQIGEYKLVAYDTNWTSADWNTAELRHHRASAADPTQPNYTAFYYNGSDCIVRDSTVPSESTSGGRTTGCAISSVHTNRDTGTNSKFLYTQYYPYTFDLTKLTTGAGPDNTGDFVYINTLDKTLYPNNQDENMSYNIQGTFTAVGKNDLPVSNFVNNCYAESVDMNLSLFYQHPIPSNNTVATLVADLRDYSSVTLGAYTIGDTIRPREKILYRADGKLTNMNTTPAANLLDFNISQGPQYFVKEMNASLTMDLGYNFSRQNNLELNPRKVTMKDFNVTYTTQPPKIWVDLVEDYNISGLRTIDQNVTFLYARVKPAQEIYNDVVAANINTPLSVVVYCDLNFTGCQNRGILSAIAQTKDDKWWKAWDHDNSALTGTGDGTIELKSTPVGLINDPLGTVTNTVQITFEAENKTVNINNGGVAPRTVAVNLVVDDPTKPAPAAYTDRWLIYDPESGVVSATTIANNVAPIPFYRVRFIGPSSWAGTGETGRVVGGNSNSIKNRRLEW